MRTHRLLSLSTVALSTALLVAACGGDDGDDGTTNSDPAEVAGSVTMWTYPVIADEEAHRSFWDDTVAAFNEDYPDVEVNIEIFPWADRDQALQTAIAGNSAPDVVYLIPDQLPGYARNLEPIDDYLDDEAKSDYLPNALEAVTIDDKMMGAPILASAVPLSCNKAVFGAVGQTEYPETWNDLLEMAPAFAAEGYSMISYPGATPSLNLSFYPLLWQAGGEVFSEDGTDVAFNSEAGVKALEFLQEMVDGGYVDDDRLTNEPPIEQTKMAQGQTACQWSTEPNTLVPHWGEENTVVLPPLTETEQITYGTVGSLSMLSSAADKEAAGAWIAFATDAETAAEYDKASGFMSVKKSVGSLYEGEPVLGEVEKYTELTTVGPLHPQARQVMGALLPEIQAVLIGEKEPQEALDDAAEAAQALIR